MTYPKAAWKRGSVQGEQEALVDMLLLGSCPALLGTFYSSFSEAARHLGGAFFMQVTVGLPSSG